ncbi:MAG: hypothetical protein LBB85_11605 [Dysgonamonadaceae bacterium]|jgi:hypothetical protein|nr:hypothetical protein [Dysgonamonadaceae bacterium]
MQVTKLMRDGAAKIVEKQGVGALWVNKKGEFFTSENLALVSVENDRDSVAKIDVVAKVAAMPVVADEDKK